MDPVLTLKGTNENTAQDYRELPQNQLAEQQILGALLINNEGLNQVGDFLLAEHFFEPVHQRIFAGISKYFEKGLIANPVTLKTYFDQDESLAEHGGAGYLVRLAASAAGIISVKDYGHTIYDLALKRRLITLGEEVVTTAYDQKLEVDAKTQIEQAEQKLFNLASAGDSERSYQPLSRSLSQAIDHTEKAFKNPGAVSGLTTGFTDIDRFLGGMQSSDLIIVAGRPSMGKTALAVTIALNAAKALQKEHKSGEPPAVAVFSLEMSSEQLASRLISAETGINSSKLRRGEIEHEDFDKIVMASKQLSQLPLFIDDTPAISISALRTRARRMKRTHNLAAIVVDYLQLMRSMSEQSKTSRVLEISEITQGLKAIAKELNIPVMALSQLSRAVEQREDKRPQLSDLRESGSIEQDADVVMFVFREEYYLIRRMPREGTKEHETWQQDMHQVHGIAEVIIAKQRNGPVGTAKLAFHSETAKFANLALNDYTPANFD